MTSEDKSQFQFERRRGFAKYILAVVGTMVVFGTAVFSLNILVDPLWYLGGNGLSDYNFVYNERYSKTNLFLQNTNKHDCIIFGSSRSTLLNEKKVSHFNCFNYSMSDGNIKEFLSFADFIKDIGKSVELLIVSVDNFSFVDKELRDRTPDFVRSRGRPPNLIWAYLAVEPFVFSLRSAVGLTPYPRYYRKDFTAAVLPGTATYRAPSKLSPEFADRYSHPRNNKYSVRNLPLFRRLREKFPQARFVGYVSPITADFIHYLYITENLDNYLDVMYQASEIFDVFFDFSIPSYVTEDPTNTYDGEHYFSAINDQIVEVLNGGAVEFGLAVHGISWPEYREKFYKATQDYVARTVGRLAGNVGVASSASSGASSDVGRQARQRSGI